ncbi:2'-5' RNA ligase family protein, partial [Tessaracoccus lubricantis]|uniref:2'-5' RNA ligase family protein n=1 Tax=Tessaracoccus lubricantis TaxID=545543 RepID=UPI003643899C
WADVLLPRYDRQPHVTVGYGGPVPKAGAAPEDPPYTPERIAAARATIRGLGIEPFRLAIGGWGTFRMTPYLCVEAPVLDALADALGENRRRPYVPHVTIGHYGVEVPLDEVAARAAAWCPPSIEPITVTGVTLLRYDAADIAGPLTAVETVAF